MFCVFICNIITDTVDPKLAICYLHSLGVIQSLFLYSSLFFHFFPPLVLRKCFLLLFYFISSISLFVILFCIILSEVTLKISKCICSFRQSTLNVYFYLIQNNCQHLQTAELYFSLPPFWLLHSVFYI